MPTFSTSSIDHYLARQPVFREQGLMRFIINGLELGWVEPETSTALQRFDTRFVTQNAALTLNAAADDVQNLMDDAALHLRKLGFIHAWRDERYAVHAIDNAGQLGTATIRFTLERGAFRRFGFCSQAVHINGIAGNNLWLGVRAATKGIDPNKMDNLAAGGIPHGESAADCLVRELAEEAGIAAALAATATPCGQLRTRRNEADGTHDEIIYCYDLAVPAHITPRNTDGEVAGFLLLTPAAAIANLEKMTWDAGLVTAQLLQRLARD